MPYSNDIISLGISIRIVTIFLNNLKKTKQQQQNITKIKCHKVTSNRVI